MKLFRNPKLDSIQTRPFIALAYIVMKTVKSKNTTAVLLGIDPTTLNNLLSGRVLTYTQAARVLAGYKKWKHSTSLETT